MEILHLINSMAPYLLLGFFLAGIMHAFVPQSIYRKHLGQANFKSVLYATLLGIPLPLCSCGVIPTAMSLRKEGASRGAVISFLIATPQTGVDSILATYSLMGLPFALVRPIAALFTAIFGGIFSNAMDKGDTEVSAATHHSTTDTNTSTFSQRLVAALRYAFVEMMQDIGKWLSIGLVAAGLITLYVPDSFFQTFAGNTPLSILLVLLFAIPMYICATGSIPIAIALMLKGLTPGAALVLLMAGPAVNVASMLVIQRVMGLRSLMVYLIAVIGGSILFALGIDYLLPAEWFTSALATHHAHAESWSVFNGACTIVLLLLLTNALLRRYVLKKDQCHCHDHGCHCGDDHCHDHACHGGDDHCHCENGSHAPEATIATPTVVYIDGMKCNHCRTNAEKAILGVNGVESATVDLSGRAEIIGSFSTEAVQTAIEALGFKVKNQR